jgi:hypothetical protein
VEEKNRYYLQHSRKRQQNIYYKVLIEAEAHSEAPRNEAPRNEAPRNEVALFPRVENVERIVTHEQLKINN